MAKFLNQKEEVNFLSFLSRKINDFSQNIYVKKIGFVTKENLNIFFKNKELCNLRVDELTKRFNNSISNYL